MVFWLKKFLTNILSILPFFWVLLLEIEVCGKVVKADDVKKNLMIQNSAKTVSCDAAQPGKFTSEGLLLPCFDEFDRNYCDTLFEEEAEFCRTNCCSVAKPTIIRPPSWDATVAHNSTRLPTIPTRGFTANDKDSATEVSIIYLYVAMALLAISIATNVIQRWKKRKPENCQCQRGLQTTTDDHPSPPTFALPERCGRVTAV